MSIYHEWHTIEFYKQQETTRLQGEVLKICTESNEIYTLEKRDVWPKEKKRKKIVWTAYLYLSLRQAFYHSFLPKQFSTRLIREKKLRTFSLKLMNSDSTVELMRSSKGFLTTVRHLRRKSRFFSYQLWPHRFGMMADSTSQEPTHTAISLIQAYVLCVCRS
jgi:hypothetical protein